MKESSVSRSFLTFLVLYRCDELAARHLTGADIRKTTPPQATPPPRAPADGARPGRRPLRPRKRAEDGTTRSRGHMLADKRDLREPKAEPDRRPAPAMPAAFRSRCSQVTGSVRLAISETHAPHDRPVARSACWCLVWWSSPGAF